MQVFGFPLSPFVRKVLLVAAEKGIEAESVAVSPRKPSAEFVAASPFRKIPALKDGDYTLSDSTAIAAYMDAVQPEPAIYPAEARARGKAIWFEEFADTIASAAGGKIVFNRFVGPKVVGVPGNEELAVQGEADMVPVLAYLERVAPASGWLTGETFSIADISVASVLRTLEYAGFAPDPALYPQTVAWYERVRARPSWAAVADVEAEAVAPFL